MMENTSNFNLMTDKAIVEYLGNSIHQKRINLNRSQSQIAKEAGVNRSTISQIENGEPITLISLIQLLRALDSLYVFNSFEIKKTVSPIALAKLEKKQRKRASGNKDNSKNESEW